MYENYKVANATQNTKFKVGQTVWCLLYGKGKVVVIDNNDPTYSVYVQFEESGELLWYTHDGKYITLANRTLFHSEPQVIAATEPVFEPKLVGKVVLVKNLGGEEVGFGHVEVELEDYVQVDDCTYYKHSYNFHEFKDQPYTFD